MTRASAKSTSAMTSPSPSFLKLTRNPILAKAAPIRFERLAKAPGSKELTGTGWVTVK